MYVKLRNRIFCEFFVEYTPPFEVGPFEVYEFVAVPGADERDISWIHSVLGVHLFCEFVSEAFRADEFLDLFTFGVFYPYKWFEGLLHDDSTLLAAMRACIPYLPVHVSLGPSAIDALSTFFSYLSDRFRRWLQGSSFEWLWFFLFLWWRFWKCEFFVYIWRWDVNSFRLFVYFLRWSCCLFLFRFIWSGCPGSKFESCLPVSFRHIWELFRECNGYIVFLENTSFESVFFDTLPEGESVWFPLSVVLECRYSEWRHIYYSLRIERALYQSLSHSGKYKTWVISYN